MISVIRSGLDASLKHIGVVSNNIANARTTGFKKSSATFQDVYAQKTTLLNPVKIGQGSLVENVRPSQTQGPLMQTGQTLDVAIEGQGMFFFWSPTNKKSPTPNWPPPQNFFRLGPAHNQTISLFIVARAFTFGWLSPGGYRVPAT